MKRTLYSICIAAVAASLATVRAEDPDQGHHAKAEKTSAGVRTSARSSGVVKSSATFHQSTPRVTARTYHSATPQNFSGKTYRNHVYSSTPNMSVKSNVTARSNVRLNRERTFTNSNRVVNRERNITNRNNVTINRERNFTNRNNFVVNRDRNVTVRNNWSGSRFAGSNYAAFRNYRRAYHDRGWWRSHYNRIVFVGGGWYFWNAGYWFPAWGYDPYYSYPYDGPIYGYNGMAPDQIIVDVQSQLQRDGYYAGPIDGELGPMTRQAIAAFQADHGLAVTSAIDEPTLSTLGIS